ncbi:hypothetical protein RVD_160 [viral metagenome]
MRLILPATLLGLALPSTVSKNAVTIPHGEWVPRQPTPFEAKHNMTTTREVEGFYCVETAPGGGTHGLFREERSRDDCEPAAWKTFDYNCEARDPTADECRNVASTAQSGFNGDQSCMLMLAWGQQEQEDDTSAINDVCFHIEESRDASEKNLTGLVMAHPALIASTAAGLTTGTLVHRLISHSLLGFTQMASLVFTGT